jgi:Rne/Rng family ribonuclease
MSKEMVISANPHETRVAILEEGQLCEYYVEREKEFALVGSIYKGRVTRVLPGMQSAFVEIGLDSDAFLYVSDFLEGIEEFDDHVAVTAEEKIQKMEGQGGQVFPANGGAAPALEPSDVEPAPAAASAPLEGPAAEEARPQAPASQPPILNTSSPDRKHFESRPRPGGRDFGRGGGGGGGRGRGGRFGRGGRGGAGGRGGDRRYGRELPPSKYASPRPFEDRSSEPGAPEGHISIILPGESLAKFREQPSPGAAPVEETPVPAASSAALEPMQESPAPSSPASFEPATETQPTAHPPARAEFRPSFGSGLEPLPGETLAKFRHAEPAVPQTMNSSAPPALDEEHEEIEEESQETHGVSEAEETHQDHATAELSDDEAAALAEHVAEAQSEELARAVQERGFAADAAGDAGASESEEHALEEEEEDAETEGMIAPPSESEHELEREQAAADDQADAEAETQDALHSLAETEHVLEAEAGVAPSEGELPVPGGSPVAQGQQPWKARVRDDFRSRMQHPGRRGGRDRGPRRDDRSRRPHQGHGHYRTPPRRPQLIADMLKQGQEIIVQIAKEPLGKKGARITSHVALPGRFLVYMPTLDHTGVSRKIASAEERSRLRHLVNEAKGASGGGFIVRTAAASAAPEEVRADVEFLTRTWSEIKTRSEQRKAPSLLHRDLNLVERMLRDHISSDYGAIWVDSEEEYTKVVDFMSRFQPTLVNRVKLYTKENPVFEEFGIQQEIDKGLRPKVWLKSGGYIVINHTEALVAIDVNTGKFVGKGSNRLEDTIVRTNLEAVKEIVRQMRLRDLGGIIIIDFIDMEERRNREKVMAALEDALKADRAPSKMLRFNEFGLIAITRKRTKQALERTLCQPCPYCTGSGMVKSIPTLCYEIQTEARKMAPEMDSGSLTLRVHPEIAKALKTRESSLVEELEKWTKKSVIIQADPTLHWEQYDIY